MTPKRDCYSGAVTKVFSRISLVSRGAVSLWGTPKGRGTCKGNTGPLQGYVGLCTVLGLGFPKIGCTTSILGSTVGSRSLGNYLVESWTFSQPVPLVVKLCQILRRLKSNSGGHFNEFLKDECRNRVFALDQKLCRISAVLRHAPLNSLPSLME